MSEINGGHLCFQMNPLTLSNGELYLYDQVFHLFLVLCRNQKIKHRTFVFTMGPKLMHLYATKIY